ncbi:MAG: hypothetical protein R3250_00040 [Melioribacteraceae bacterium]|nr:hypothetical protein [Melioribacteraceae bacterium]
MANNRIQEAVRNYERLASEAARTYESTLRKAEQDLRQAIESCDVSEPLEEEKVTMTRSDYDELQNQLSKVQAYIAKNPSAIKN